MALHLYEAPDSRPVSVRANDQTQITRWHVKADAGEDEVDAYFFVLLNTPVLNNNLIRRGVKIDPVAGRTDRWTAEVEYGTTGQDGTADALGTTPSDPALKTPSQPLSQGDTPSTAPLGPGYSFEISSGTAHITHSRRQMGRVARGANAATGTITLTGTANVVQSDNWGPAGSDDGTVIWLQAGVPAGWYPGGYKIVSDAGGGLWQLDRAPARAGAAGLPAAAWVEKPSAADFQNAIGVSAERIEGVDVRRPTMSFTRTVSVAGLSMAYIKQLYGLVGRKNNAPFYGFGSGEVLYDGCSGQHSTQDRYSVPHRFLVNLSESDIAVVPGELVVPFKRGWDYLWVEYEEVKDPANSRVVTRPRGVYVEEVYPDGDFLLIGIGR